MDWTEIVNWEPMASVGSDPPSRFPVPFFFIGQVLLRRRRKFFHLFGAVVHEGSDHPPHSRVEGVDRPLPPPWPQCAVQLAGIPPVSFPRPRRHSAVVAVAGGVVPERPPPRQRGRRGPPPGPGWAGPGAGWGRRVPLPRNAGPSTAVLPGVSCTKPNM